VDPEFRARLVRWLAWFAVIVPVLLIMPTAFFAAAPVGCASCHESRGLAPLPAASAHSGVACTACHVGASLSERVTFGYYHAFGMTLPLVDTRDTSISTVQDSSCVSCHANLPGISESRGLRIAHDSCSVGSRCVDCHAGVTHLDGLSWPRTYSMEACLECHGVREVSQECDSCHVGRLDRTIPTTGTFPVTHGPNWRQTHGMGSMPTCRACHADDFCTGCHGPGVPHTPRFVSVHGPIARSADAQCLTCHEQSFCDDCHGYRMPHPAAFAEEHIEIVKTDGDEQCGLCHDQSDCVNCHTLHVHPGGAGPLAPERGDAR